MAKNDPYKDDEDWWNSSEKHSFSFDQNTEVDNLFGISKNGTAQLRAGISNIEISDSNIKYNDVEANVKPLLSIISEPALMAILNADKIYLPEEQPIVDTTITLRRILLGQSFSLVKYKSLADKTALLDDAITTGNGDAILSIVLFITRTLKPALVQSLLMKRPEATSIYVHYLSARLMINEMIDLLSTQGRAVEGAMMNVNMIIKTTSDETQLVEKLAKAYNSQIPRGPQYRETSALVSYIELLAWKVALKETSYKLEPNCTPLDCLRYCCINHWGASKEKPTSPETFSRLFHISPRHYQKIAVESRVSVQAWRDIDAVLISESWRGEKKLVTVLDIEEILEILHKGKAPTDVLHKYLKFVDDMGRRLHLARTFPCPKAVIEILEKQGDRTALMEYRDTLIPLSEDFFLAEKALFIPEHKRKSRNKNS